MQDGQPRWEWRSFAPEFRQLDGLVPAEITTARDVYLLCAGSTAAVKIRDGVITVKLRERVHQGLELWRPTLAATFPLCQREIRDVLRCFPAALPRTLVHPEYDALGFVADVAACTPGVRVIGVYKTLHKGQIDQCLVERGCLSAAGSVVQTAAVESTDPEAVLRTVHELRLDRFENVSYVTFLTRMLARPASAQAPSEGAHHETPALPHIHVSGDRPVAAGAGANSGADR